MSEHFEGITHTHGRGDIELTGHIARDGSSLCGFERPHMNIEWVFSDRFDKWLQTNRGFETMCKRCLKIYASIDAAETPQAKGEEQP